MTLIGLTLTMNHLTGGILSIAVSLSPTSTVSFILKVNICPLLSQHLFLYYVCLISDPARECNETHITFSSLQTFLQLT